MQEKLENSVLTSIIDKITLQGTGMYLNMVRKDLFKMNPTVKPPRSDFFFQQNNFFIGPETMNP